jgi:hypothetical protein
MKGMQRGQALSVSIQVKMKNPRYGCKTVYIMVSIYPCYDKGDTSNNAQ